MTSRPGNIHDFLKAKPFHLHDLAPVAFCMSTAREWEETLVLVAWVLARVSEALRVSVFPRVFESACRPAGNLCTWKTKL